MLGKNREVYDIDIDEDDFIKVIREYLEDSYWIFAENNDTYYVYAQEIELAFGLDDLPNKLENILFAIKIDSGIEIRIYHSFVIPKENIPDFAIEICRINNGGRIRDLGTITLDPITGRIYTTFKLRCIYMNEKNNKALYDTLDMTLDNLFLFHAEALSIVNRVYNKKILELVDLSKEMTDEIQKMEDKYRTGWNIDEELVLELFKDKYKT